MSADEIFVFYGSQTGQAETIAESIHGAAEEHDIKSALLCLWKAEEVFKIISDGSVPVVFVCSTTGDGELPGNARKFMRVIQRKTLPGDHLSKLKYALLGLGDSNYSTFCGGPKTLERGLKKLGARSFYPTGFADDGTDLEIVVEPWLEGLWPALKSHMGERKKFLEIPPEHVSFEAEVGSSALDHKFQTELNLSPVNGNINGFSMKKSYIPGESKGRLEVKQNSSLLELSKNCDGTLPPLLQSFIKYEFVENQTELKLPTTPCFPYPLAESDKFHTAAVKSVVKLTAENAVKTAYCVTLKTDDDFSYEPGDSFGLFVPNPNDEVDWLIERLKVKPFCDNPLKLKIDPNTTKKNAKIPNFFPELSTIRYILQNCVEIRSVPKRSFLRALYDHTSSERDRRILLQLCQKESMNQFSKFVREPNLNIIDILVALPSCKPPFETLIEHLPRLRARLYSASSCLDFTPNELRFVFNVVDFEPTDGRMYSRKGLCTGFLSSLADNLACSAPSRVIPNLTIFKTKNNTFHLPDTMVYPIVMVGPGTGVAPFIGFLERIRSQMRQNANAPESWLFYGCRHKNRDFLFETELNSFVGDGTLAHLVVAYSRDSATQDRASECQPPRYVQHNLKLHSDSILNLILRKSAIFYVCGDARNMAKDVREAIVEILSKEMTKDVAMETFRKLVKDGKYKEDVWT